MHWAVISVAVGMVLGWRMLGWWGVRRWFSGLCLALAFPVCVQAQNNFVTWSPHTGTGTMAGDYDIAGYCFPVGMTAVAFQVSDGLLVSHPVWAASLNSGTNSMQGPRYVETIFVGLDSGGHLAAWMDGAAGTWGPLYETGTAAFSATHDFNSTTFTSTVVPSGWASGSKLRLNVGFEAISLVPTSMPSGYSRTPSTSPTSKPVEGSYAEKQFDAFSGASFRTLVSDSSLNSTVSPIGGAYSALESFDATTVSGTLAAKVDSLMSALIGDSNGADVSHLVAEGSWGEAAARPWISSIFANGEGGTSSWGAIFYRFNEKFTAVQSQLPTVFTLINLFCTFALAWGFFWFHFNWLVWAFGLKPGGFWLWLRDLSPFGAGESDMAVGDLDGEYPDIHSSIIDAARGSSEHVVLDSDEGPRSLEL